jgi:tetratricopeptide (TPR) repeat protein
MPSVPNLLRYETIRKHYELLERINEEKDKEVILSLCLKDIDLAEQFILEYHLYADERIKYQIEEDKILGEYDPTINYEEKYSYYHNIPRYPSFKQVAIIYEKMGMYKQAIDICDKAISHDLNDDGTKGGMEERIRKLEKKLK